MKLRYLLASLLGIVLALFVLAWWIGHADTPAVSKSALWRAEFVDLQGKKQTIRPPGQRPVLINFWASWCGPCREEMPTLAILAQEFQGRVDFVGVAVDNTESVNQFLRTTPVPYPVLLGNADVLALMQAQGNEVGVVPFTVIYTADGHKLVAKAGKIPENLLREVLQKAISA